MSCSRTRGALTPLRLVAACTALIFFAGATAETGPMSYKPGAGHVQTLTAANTRGIFIVAFDEAPVANYDGSRNGLHTIPRRNGKLDVASSAAKDYANFVADRQQEHLVSASARIGRTLVAQQSFRHALNAVVVELGPEEAERLRTMPGVTLVEPYTEYPTDTDAGPTLIGAPGLWNGTADPAGVATKGEGIVVGMIDSGINTDSPSFAAIEPATGFVHVNPLGDGNYLGTCSGGGIDVGKCNAKLFGAYDFVFSTCQDASNPCGSPGTWAEDPSVEDANDTGHGSHTSSTVAGNASTAIYQGANIPISGVAPHANIIHYDVCYKRLSDGAGLCPNVSSVAAANQAVADGIVDVINFSIGGGAQPWSDSVSLAFLGAHNAGIFVSTSAGNSGPGASTLGHVEPWTATVGNATHNRFFAGTFNLTAPALPPPNTQNIVVQPGAIPWATTPLVNLPLIVSPNFGAPPSDGCTAYPANFFRRPAIPAGTQGIAVIRLPLAGSLCGSAARRTAALNAGAAATIFVVDGTVNLGANQTSWWMLTPDWNNVFAHANTDLANATASVSAPATPFYTGTPDVMNSSSSRGPSGFDLLKPDLIAPGTSILAAVSGPSTAYDLFSGTSMASPHNAGSAALLRALHPTWTPTELKSALTTTTKTTALLKEDGVTPATPLDRGAGRLDVATAAKVGLIFNETGANFSAANPATGGDPTTLNLASMANDNCAGTCTFARTVRSARAGTVTYTLAVNGFPPGAASVNPPSFTIGTSGTRQINVSVNSTLLPQDVWSFGELTLTPSNPQVPVSHLPIAIRAAQPDIDVTPTSLNVSLVTGESTTRPVIVRNLGNPTLNWSYDEVGLGTMLLLQQSNNNANGFRVDFFNNQAPTPAGVYGAEDVTPTDNAVLRTIQAEGFLLGNGTAGLNTIATGITFKLYSSSGVIPGGNPEAPAGAELYSCTRTPNGPNSAGLTFLTADGASFRLDTAAATGCPLAPTMSAGSTYWVSVFPSVPGTAVATTRQWLWFRATVANGNAAVTTSPAGLFSVPPTWTAITGGVAGFATTIQGDVQCGAPWLESSSPGGALGVSGQSDVTLTIDAAALTPGSYRAFACFATNGSDPDESKVVVPVNLTVTPVPTSLSVAGAAMPGSVARGAIALLTAEVTPGTDPASTGVAVHVDLSAIGSGSEQAMYDDGSHGDAVAGDGTYSLNATVAPDTVPGNKLLDVSVGDDQGRTAQDAIALQVIPSTAPSGVGAAAPMSVEIGDPVLLTVDVTPGTSPASTGLAVLVNLAAIGGSPVQTFYDDGSHGDAVANDGVFSFEAVVADGFAPGPVSLPVSIADAQLRVAATTIDLTLTDDIIFVDGFEE